MRPGRLNGPTKSQFLRLCMAVHNRNKWFFAGSLRAGQRAANIMSLIQSAKLKGHDPYRYLKDVLERLPTQPASRLEEVPMTAFIPECQS